jgi:hypothetical protein
MFDSLVTGVILASSDGTADHYCLYGVAGSSPNNAQLSVVKTPDSAIATDAGALVAGQAHKVTYSHSDGFTYASGDGSVSANAAQTGVPADTTRLDIGQGLGALYWLNGRIFTLTIRPNATSSTDLDALST